MRTFLKEPTESFYTVDHRNRKIGTWKDGDYDVSRTGERCHSKYRSWTTIVRRAAYAREGSIVALEPESGEILAMITAPSYDPNEPGRLRSKLYYVVLRQYQ